jgi:hypothetical protein
MKVTEAHVQSANLDRFRTLEHTREKFVGNVTGYDTRGMVNTTVRLDTKLNSVTREHHYFSVTGAIYEATVKGARDKRYNDCVSGGCIHDQILQAFTQLQPLVNAHLACIYTGEPLHSVANGYYFMYGPKDSVNLDYAAKTFGCTLEELNDIKHIISASPNHGRNLRRRFSSQPYTACDFVALEAHYVSPIEAYLAPKWLATRDAALA